MSTPLRLAVIQGSTRDGALGPTVANWLLARAAARPEFTTDLIDLAETPLPTVFPQLGQAPARAGDLDLLAAVSPRLAAADAFVVVTPEYNHSFPASLKNAIDWHNSEWHAKPVAFVAYGGFSAGLRAVEHLRGVFAELHAVTIREAVGLQGVWGQFDAEGRAVDPATDAAAEAMLDRLTWWAEALRAARAATPYAA
ncbi:MULTISPECIES: NAD(P)H-dependent oxidoreductase [unclassified Streptomyces]|uniref:NADPH-dependent FMN reductase n=1 Tax=unclassified Streptomyces TaxID=2593676 RepID=UPI0006F6A181|nr:MULTISPECIES: NAD(P)H-dependent oxidoreductase [unclassified Streptomyces]KQX58997.1 NADPH-dependent FMN reductase [Streptomyces sp. Root1304]KRB00258.1 NADPH-dependent FMN reductase [Streptomyces sp. Root66D1]